MDLPVTFWLSITTGIVLFCSLFILPVQAIHNYRQSTNALRSKTDAEKDIANEPFPNENHLKRIIFDTFVSSASSVFTLVTNNCYNEASTRNSIQESNYYAIIGCFITFTTWAYVFTIVLTHFCFPSLKKIGWILNVHLFILCLFLLSASSSVLIEALWNNPDMSFIQCLPLFVPVISAFDLVCTTGSVRRGPSLSGENSNIVNTISVDSIFGTLFFNWMTPLLAAIRHKGKDFTDADFPRLPAARRGYNIFYIFGKTSGKGLLYRIYRTNRSLIALQALLKIVDACLSYATPFFLNRLLSIIQDIAAGKDKDGSIAVAVGYLFAMTCSHLLYSLIHAQCEFQNKLNLRAKIIDMLRIEIYGKTLRCVDLSLLNGKNSNNNDEEGCKKEPAELNTSTVFRLLYTDTSNIAEYFCDWSSTLSLPIQIVIGLYFIYTLLSWSCIIGLFFIIVMIPINRFMEKLVHRRYKKHWETMGNTESLLEETLQGIRQIKLFAWESSRKKHILKLKDAEITTRRSVWIVRQLNMILQKGGSLLVFAASFWLFTHIQGREVDAALIFTTITLFGNLSHDFGQIPTILSWWSLLFFHIERVEKYLNGHEVQHTVSASETSNKVPCNDHSRYTDLDTVIGFKDATVSWPVSDMLEPKEELKFHNNMLEKPVELKGTSRKNVFVLKDLNVTFPHNKLSLICGPTGSGKTLLMLSLLSETRILSGSVFLPRSAPIYTLDTTNAINSIEVDKNAPIVPDNWILKHTVAYVSQRAWLQNASIKDNILFDLPYAEKRYKATLTACALDEDLAYLEDGDLTEIGEKGVILSGGQKARVTLARAVYSRAQKVLMDDVLSAVDAHTGKHLYHNCLMSPLMQNRTQILITHNVNLCIQGSAYIVFIKDGRVKLSGSPEELRKKNQLSQVFEENINKAKEGDETDVDTTCKETTPNNKQQDRIPKTLMQEEKRTTGRVKLAVYRLLLELMGGWVFWAAFISLTFYCEALSAGSSWWLKYWADSYGSLTSKLSFETDTSSTGYINSTLFLLNSTVKQFDTHVPNKLGETNYGVLSPFLSLLSRRTQTNYSSLNYYLTVYVMIKAFNIFTYCVHDALVTWGGTNAGKKLYCRLLDKVFQAPLRYFDTTPINRIASRFSNDFSCVDERAPVSFSDVCIYGANVLFIAGGMIFTMPVLIFPMVIIGVVNILVTFQFMYALRELNRMRSMSRSPLSATIEKTLSGITTIRAFNMTQLFMLKMIDGLDIANRCPYYLDSCINWIEVRTALMSAVITFITGSMILFNIDHMDAASAGLCFRSILIYSKMMIWMVRRYGDAELCFNSVERVTELLEIDQEAPSVTGVKLPADWPSKGLIEIKNLHVKYAPELETVLKGLSFTVKPQEKIGIVGRTGSGKSTLVTSFYRFVEAVEGSIVIDGINIADIGTKKLRSSLSIIPQDPLLFSGTIRSNLDPFDQFTDDDILAALQKVHLLEGPSRETTTKRDSVLFFSEADKPRTDISIKLLEKEKVNQNVFKDLGTSVTNNGNNFSQGQIQLLCLARALLHHKKIVIMDEATASVDFETDRAIQKTLSTYFTDCTILCIAHRLNTVMEYDRILVLDHGEKIEFSNPLELIRDSNSKFHRMCRESGEYETLLKLAVTKHELINTS